ncbi:MAG: 4Fe-4S binding protein, partial [Fusobacteriaceae bacterium]
KLDKYLSYIKYFVLALVIFFTWKTATLVIDPYDPFSTLSHLPDGLETVLISFFWGFIILVAMILVSFFYERLFCKYICPLGALYAIIGKFSFFKIKRNKNSCINCDKCTKICPSHIEVSKLDEVKSVECYSCMKCVEVCPTKLNSLDVTLSNKKSSVKKLIITGLIIFFGFIGVSKFFGIFQTMPSTMVEVVKSNPENIRGWMTFEEVIKEFNLDKAEFYSEIGLTEEEAPLSMTVKKSNDIFEAKGFGSHKGDTLVREAVAKILSKKK